jgi:hypothetical protein
MSKMSMTDMVDVIESTDAVAVDFKDKETAVCSYGTFDVEVHTDDRDGMSMWITSIGGQEAEGDNDDKYILSEETRIMMMNEHYSEGYQDNN